MSPNPQLPDPQPPHSQQRHEFTVTDSELRYSGPIFAVRRDTVTMPGGGTSARDVVEHDGAVAVAAVDAEHNIALIEQYRHPVARRLFEIPAGLLDGPATETPVAAAQRELLEETGLVAKSWRVLADIAPSPGFCDEAIRVFLATDISAGEQPTPSDEEADITLHWVPIADAVTWVLRGEIVNATAATAVLAVDAAVRAGIDTLRTPDAPWPGRPNAFARRSKRWP